jgi:hypothetical protein
MALAWAASSSSPMRSMVSKASTGVMRRDASYQFRPVRERGLRAS